MLLAFVLLPLACFLCALVQCIYENLTAKKTIVYQPTAQKIEVVEPPPPRRQTLPPKRRSTMQIGAVTCEVVQFEDFDLIRTNENAAQW